MEKIECLLDRARRARERVEQAEDDLRQEMRRVFEKRVALNRQGHTGDVVRGQ